MVSARPSAIRIHAGDWSIELPEDWKHDVEDEVLSLYRDDVDGTLTLSSATSADGDVTDRDLREFAAEAAPSGAGDIDTVRFGAFRGTHARSADEDRRWRHWFLRHGPLLVMAAYQCGEEIEGRHDAAVLEALESLRPESPGDNS